MVNFTLPSTTNEIISISTSQTVRSWVVISIFAGLWRFYLSFYIRYARTCSSYEWFILRARRLSSKLLKHGYLMERLKSSLKHKARSHQRPDQPPLSPALEKWADRQWAGLDRGERMLVKNTAGIGRARSERSWWAG